MKTNRILWARVWGIAGLQGAITLSWVIYNLYLPQLLMQIGLSKELAVTLLILENLLEAIIEPVFGSFSDGQQRNYGSRLPLIMIGMLSASILFLALPSLVILPLDNIFSRVVFPILAVAWASAMAVFRAPAMALLGQLATASSLPRAASILTLAGGTIGAFRFDAYGWILGWGVGFAFALGSFSLLATAFILRWLNPPGIPSGEDSILPAMSVSKYRLLLLFVTGIAVGWGLRFLVPAVKQIVTGLLGGDNSKIALTLFFIVMGLSAIPAGKIASRWGNSLAMIAGSILVILSLLLSQFLPAPWNLALLLGFVPGIFSLVLNGAIPYALTLVSASHAGLGVGMYFGGFNAGVGLFEFIFSNLGQNDLNANVWGVSYSFTLVILCLCISRKFLPKKQFS